MNRPVILNSGLPVGNHALASSQERVREGFLERLRAGLVRDERVEAVWIVGSLARDDFDVLSDIDLVVTVSPGAEMTFVPGLPAAASQFGEVAIANHVPMNAPAGGYFLAVLYDVEPLPMFCDWTVWPFQPLRPSDARVLFERRPALFTTGGSFDEMMSGVARADVLLTGADVGSSRLYMVPIIAKDAVRGWFESVDTMTRYLPFPVSPMRSTPSALLELRRVVDDHAHEEPTVAVAAVRRYLSAVEQLMRSG